MPKKQRNNMPVVYRTGYSRLDVVLNAIAAGTTVLSVITVVGLIGVAGYRLWERL
jgi:hypothetical protein